MATRCENSSRANHSSVGRPRHAADSSHERRSESVATVVTASPRAPGVPRFATPSPRACGPGTASPGRHRPDGPPPATTDQPPPARTGVDGPGPGRRVRPGPARDAPAGSPTTPAPHAAAPADTDRSGNLGAMWSLSHADHARGPTTPPNDGSCPHNRDRGLCRPSDGRTATQWPDDTRVSSGALRMKRARRG